MLLLLLQTSVVKTPVMALSELRWSTGKSKKLSDQSKTLWLNSTFSVALDQHQRCSLIFAQINDFPHCDPRRFSAEFCMHCTD